MDNENGDEKRTKSQSNKKEKAEQDATEEKGPAWLQEIMGAANSAAADHPAGGADADDDNASNGSGGGYVADGAE